MYTKIQTGIWNKWDHLTVFNSQFLPLKNVHLDLMVRKPGVCLQASHFTFPTAAFLYSNSQFSSVKSLSHVWLFATPWTAARQASLSITIYQSVPKPMSIELVMSSNHLILCLPLLLLPSIFPSIRVFSNESAISIRWPKYWSCSFNISPCNEQPGLISFKMDRLDLLVVQGSLQSLLQHHSSKVSILRC